MQAPPDPYTAPPSNPNKNRTVLIIVGVCLAALCLPIIILAAILFPVFSQAKIAAQRTQALRNLKDISTALNLYAVNYNDHLPPSDQWETAVRSHLMTPSSLVPVRGGPSSFAFNEHLNGHTLYLIERQDTTPLVFESSLPGPNAAGGESALALRGDRACIAFVNGSARTVIKTEVPDLSWHPEAARR